jgi:hypothetical protein
VPATNPFVGRAGVLPEIWSVGLRNPWRWSFDDPARGGTGALLIGDVGQGAWEEINHEPAGRGGRNYGWRNREGAHDNVTSPPPFSQPLTDPIFEYPRSEGQSVTGGYVYRGSALGLAFRGRYVFGDFVRGRVWSIRLTINASTGEATASDRIDHTAELGPAAASPAAFGVDASGELYVVNYGGTIYRLAGTDVAVAPGRRRPASAPIVGWAVPRDGTGTPSSVASQPSAVRVDERAVHDTSDSSGTLTASIGGAVASPRRGLLSRLLALADALETLDSPWRRIEAADLDDDGRIDVIRVELTSGEILLIAWPPPV